MCVACIFSYIGEGARNTHVYEGSGVGEETSNTHMKVENYTCERSEEGKDTRNTHIYGCSELGEDTSSGCG